MKLYRLFTAKNAPYVASDKAIKPCIPRYRLDDEDKTTPRICVSKTLDGCLSSIGPPKILGAFDYEAKCAKFVILQFERSGIPDGHFISNTRLLSLGYVRDAIYTDECWITAPCRSETIRISFLTDFRLCGDGRIALDGELMRVWTVCDSKWTDSSSEAAADVIYDDAGNIVDLALTSEFANEEDAIFKVIAPFVKSGSYIEIHGEGSEQFRYLFDGKQCLIKKPKITW